MSEKAADELTIDELARETGMTVRNIRAHQSRGLLPPPVVRARTGYYGPEHVARLRLIQDMQAEGFNLKAIERLVTASPGGGEQLLDFGRAVLSAFGDEEPELLTRLELEARMGGPEPKALKKALRLGVVRAIADDMYEVPSPTLLKAGTELVRMGVPPLHALAVAEQIQRSTRSIAEAFARVVHRRSRRRQHRPGETQRRRVGGAQRGARAAAPARDRGGRGGLPAGDVARRREAAAARPQAP